MALDFKVQKYEIFLFGKKSVWKETRKAGTTYHHRTSTVPSPTVVGLGSELIRS